MSRLSFTKGHALGNDYLVVTGAGSAALLTAALVRALCDRAGGAGGDGLVAVVRSGPQAASVEVWNADGSRAEVSGNGLRIAALALARDRSRPWRLDLTSAGRTYPVTGLDGGRVAIRLGPAHLGEPRETVPVGAAAVRLTVVDVGNPHAVLQAGEVEPDRWPELARTLASHPRFPVGTNVERLEILGPASIAIRIHERGVGPTAASGTGAAAAVAAAHALGLVDPGPVAVTMEGGRAEVSAGADGIELVSAVELVYEGVVDPDWLASRRAG